eukprot:2286105-Pyramimonas_sp.AAC.1
MCIRDSAYFGRSVSVGVALRAGGLLPLHACVRLVGVSNSSRKVVKGKRRSEHVTIRSHISTTVQVICLLTLVFGGSAWCGTGYIYSHPTCSVKTGTQICRRRGRGTGRPVNHAEQQYDGHTRRVLII